MKKHKDTFEELLNEAFLEMNFDAPENEVLLEATAESVLGSTAIIGPSFGERLLDVLVSKWGITSIVLVGLGSFWAFQSNTNTINYKPYKAQLEATVYVEEPIVFYEKEDIVVPLDSVISLEQYEHQQTIPLDSNTNKVQLVPENRPAVVKQRKRKRALGTIPLITFEEMRENRKAKEKLFKAVSKLSKHRLAKIKFNQDQAGKEESELADFAMWTTEVTNIEYRIFLRDLLIHKKYKDYYKANVVDEAWVTYFNHAYNEPMMEHYFSHPAYDQYPVVNVTREGAELFCDWLNNGIRDYRKDKEETLYVRIPTEQEWIYAASVGGKYMDFPWGGPRITNNQDCYLANFRPDGGNFSDDGGMYTVKADSYNPNDLGLYNMSGNVAEMISYDSTTVGTKGGSWYSYEDEIKINGADPYVNKRGARPTVGFRPIVLLRNPADS